MGKWGVSSRYCILPLLLIVITAWGLSACDNRGSSTGSIGGNYQIVSGLQPNSQEVVRVEEFIAFSCSHCAEYHERFADHYEQYGDRVERVTIPFHASKDPGDAHRLYYVAEANGVGPEAKARLYQAFNGEGGAAVEDVAITAIAEELGILDVFQSEKDSSAIDERIEADRKKAHAYGVPGTPILVIGGQLRVYADSDNFQHIVDQLLIDG